MLKTPSQLHVSQAGNIWDVGMNQFIKNFIILISKERVSALKNWMLMRGRGSFTNG